MIDLALAAAWLLGIALTGAIWLLGVSGRRGRVPRRWIAAAAFPAGAFLYTQTVLLFMLAGVALRGATAVAILGIVFAAGVLFAAGRGGRPGRDANAGARFGRAERMIALLLLVILGWQSWDLARTPYDGDGRAYWRVKSVALAREGTIRSPLFTHPATMHTHKTYPVLVPLVQASLMSVAPGISEEGERAVYVAFLISLYAILWAALRTHAAPLPALLVLLAFTAASRGRLTSGYVTVALSCYLTGVVALGLGAVRDRNRACLAVAAVLGAGLIFTKSEGLPYLGIFAVVLALDALRRRAARELLDVGILVGLAAVLALGWLLFRPTLPATFEDRYFANLSVQAVLEGLPRVPYLLSMVLAEFFSAAAWGAVWVLGFFALRRGRPPLPLVLFPLALVGAWLMVCLVDPQSLHYYLNTGFRFLFTIAALVVLWTGPWLARAETARHDES